MFTNWLSGSVALFIVSIVLLTSCKQAEEREGLETTSKSGEREKVFHINAGAEPETLDPILNYSVAGANVIRIAFEGLVRLDENNQPIPASAESWSHNEDYTEWTFSLQPDSTWHNGDPVTAYDFIYGVKRILTPSLAASYANNVRTVVKGGAEYYEAGGLKGDVELSSVIAVDEKTVVYKLENPTPYFLTLASWTCFFPAHQKTIEEYGEKWSMTPESYNGNGPYQLASYRSKDKAIFKKFSDHWDSGNLYWDEIHVYMIESGETEIAAFETGNLHMTSGVTLSQVKRWEGKPEWNSNTVFGTQYISLNHEKSPFNDEKVRRAFSLAIDRTLLTDKVMRRGEVPAGGIIPPNLGSPEGNTYRQRAGDLIGKQNMEAARTLLEEAGYNEENPLPKIEYLYDTGESNKFIAEQLQAMWKEAFDIDVQIQNVEWGVLTQKSHEGNFQMAANGWYGDYLDPMTFLELWLSESNMNFSGYTRDEYDQLIEQAMKEKDPVKREGLLIDAEKLLIERDMAVIPVYHYADPVLIDPAVNGVTINSLGGIGITRAYITH